MSGWQPTEITSGARPSPSCAEPEAGDYPPVTARLGCSLTENDRDVIRERHFGWERATPKLLAAVFGVSVQQITAILNPARHVSHPEIVG